MFNKLYIIVERASTKMVIWWRFSIKDMVYIVLGFLAGYSLVNLLFDELYGMIAGLLIAAFLGVLLYEMDNHLSILDHIKKCYLFYFVEPREYYYRPKCVVMNRQNDMRSEDDIEWEEFQRRISENAGRRR